MGRGLMPFRVLGWGAMVLGLLLVGSVCAQTYKISIVGPDKACTSGSLELQAAWIGAVPSSPVYYRWSVLPPHEGVALSSTGTVASISGNILTSDQELCVRVVATANEDGSGTPYADDTHTVKYYVPSEFKLPELSPIVYAENRINVKDYLNPKHGVELKVWDLDPTDNFVSGDFLELRVPGVYEHMSSNTTRMGMPHCTSSTPNFVMMRIPPPNVVLEVGGGGGASACYHQQVPLKLTFDVGQAGTFYGNALQLRSYYNIAITATGPDGVTTAITGGGWVLDEMVYRANFLVPGKKGPYTIVASISPVVTIGLPWPAVEVTGEVTTLNPVYQLEQVPACAGAQDAQLYLTVANAPVGPYSYSVGDDLANLSSPQPIDPNQRVLIKGDGSVGQLYALRVISAAHPTCPSDEEGVFRAYGVTGLGVSAYGVPPLCPDEEYGGMRVKVAPLASHQGHELKAMVTAQHALQPEPAAADWRAFDSDRKADFKDLYPGLYRSWIRMQRTAAADDYCIFNVGVREVPAFPFSITVDPEKVVDQSAGCGAPGESGKLAIQKGFLAGVLPAGESATFGVHLQLQKAGMGVAERVLNTIEPGDVECTFSGLAVGVYDLRVSLLYANRYEFPGRPNGGSYMGQERNQCEIAFIQGIEVDFEDAFTPTANVVKPLCAGGTGEVVVVASGGSEDWSSGTVSWDIGAAGWAEEVIGPGRRRYKGIPAGTGYRVTITRRTCELTLTFDMEEPPALQFAAPAAITDVSACGTNDGAVEVSATGGTPAYQWAITQGIASAEPSVYGEQSSFGSLGAGPYQVWVRDANGCTPGAALDVTVGSDTQISLASVLTEAACHGQLAALELKASGNGAYPAQVDLLHGGAAVWTGTLEEDVPQAVPYNLRPGQSYVLVARDARGCEVVLPQPNIRPKAVAPLVARVQGEVKAATSCNDDGAVEVVAEGGTPAYEWAITQGAASAEPAMYGTISNFVGLDAGVRKVWLRDANGCKPEEPLLVTIEREGRPSVSVELEEARCAGDAAHVKLTASGDGIYPLKARLDQSGTPVWNGALYRDVELLVPYDLTQGIAYDVVVADQHDCGADIPTPTITPVLRPALSIDNLTASPDTHCPEDPGDPTGKVTALITGDAGPFTYKLYKDGQLLSEGATQPDGAVAVEGLTSGEYRLEAMKGECAVLTHTPPSVIVTGKRNVNLAAYIVKHPNQGVADGEIRASAVYESDEGAAIAPVFGVVPPAGIVITPDGANQATLSQVPAGTYRVTAMVDGCTFQSGELEVVEQPPLTVKAEVVQPSCAGINAQVDLTVTGGIEPYSIVWTYADGSPVPAAHLEDGGLRLLGLSEGSFRVTVRDAAVPQGEVVKVVTIVPFVVSQVSVAVRRACQGDDGQAVITLTANGSSDEADLRCELVGSGVAQLPFDAAHKAQFTGVTPGSYELKVYDANGCNTLETGVSVVIDPYFVERAYAVLPAECPPDAVEGRTTSSYTFDYLPAESVHVEYALEGADGVLGAWHEHNPQDGAWQPTFEGVTPGTYTLHVRDAGGATCTLKKAGVEIRSLAPYGLTLESEHSGGCGASFHYTKIRAQGSAMSGSSYFWTMPDGAEVSGMSEHLLPVFGSYTVQIREGECRSLSVSAELKKREALTVTLITKSFAPDGGVLKASVHLSIAGGVPFDNAGQSYYKYYVVGNDDAGAFDPLRLTEQIEPNGRVEGLLQGRTKLIVADQHLCHYSHVLIPGAFSLPVELAEPELYHPVCIGQSNGSIVVRLKEGYEREGMVFILEERDEDLGWRYVMTSGDGVFQQLKGATYRVRAKDKVGQATISAEIELRDPEPMAFVFTHDGTKPTCPGGSYSAVKCAVSGGTPPYLSAVWEYGDVRFVGAVEEGNIQLTRAKSGHYRLVVTDSQGCEYIGEHTYAGIEPYRLAMERVPALCVAYEEGSLIINKIEGGIPEAPVSLTWITAPRGDKPSFRRGDPVQLGRGYSLPAGRWELEAVQGSCIDTLSVDIETVNPPLRLKFEDKVNTICYNARIDSIALSGDGVPLDPEVYGVHWEVTHGVGSASPVRVGMLPLSKAGGAVQYYRSDRNIMAPTWMRAKVKSPSGCIDTVGKLVVTHPSMHFAFDKLNSRASVLGADEQGRPLIGVLSGIPTELAFIYSPGVTNAAYTFSPSEMFSAGSQPDRFMFTMPDGLMQDPNYEPYLTQIARGKRTYAYLVGEVSLTNDQTGCTEKVGLLARSVNDLTLPNVFTPNGDGKNDRWLQQGDPTYENIFTRLSDLLPNIEVEVYTRSGVQVWSAKGAKVSEGWDGRSSRDGGQMPIGTYYYVMRFNVPNAGKAWKPISGSVTIVR